MVRYVKLHIDDSLEGVRDDLAVAAGVGIGFRICGFLVIVDGLLTVLGLGNVACPGGLVLLCCHAWIG